MKRKFLVLLCIVMIVAVAFASCNKDNNDNNDNTDTNVGDNSNNGDNTNDTCEHTFSESWSANSTDHWHAATCEHNTEKSDLAPHADTNEDGECDTCEYSMPHTHTYADAWTTDETHHWHAATCTHTGEKSGYAEHSDTAPADGSCDVCGAEVEFNVDTTDFAELIATIVANAGSVKNGEMLYRYQSNSNASIAGSVTVKNIRYEFGNNSLYMVVSTQASDGSNSLADTTEYWYELVSAEEVFGVVKETYDGFEGDIALNGGATLESMIGYYCAVSTLTNAYGAENLLATLYAISQLTDPTGTTISSDYVQVTPNGKDIDMYGFSFNALVLNRNTAEGTIADYYEVTVKFNFSEHGVLTDLCVVCDCYTNSLEDKADWDYDFDSATETITMRDTATADTYTFSFKQTVGERTYVNEHPKSNYIPTDFDIFLDEELTTTANGALNIVAGTVNHLYLGAFIPEGTSISFIADSFIATLNTDDCMVFTNAISGNVLVKVDSAGTYTLTISAGDITKTVTVTVTAEDNGNGGDVVLPEHYITVTITDNNTYFDVATFTAAESGTYSFFIPAGCGAWDKTDCDTKPFTSTPYVDPNTQPDGGSFTIELAEGTTYEFYVLSPEKNIDLVIEYKFVAHEVEIGGNNGDNTGSASAVVSGTYTGTAKNQGAITLVIDNDAKTLVVTLAKGSIINYTYTVENGVVTLSNANGAIAESMAIYFGGLNIDADGNPVEFLYNGYTFTVLAGGSGDNGDGGNDNTTSLVIGSNTITVTDKDITNESINMTFTVTEEGTYTFESNELMVNILDSDGFMVGRGSAYLEAGTYTASIYVGLVSEPGDYTLTLTYTAPEVNDNEGLGTEENPYVIDGMIGDVTFVSDTINKVYYIFTADKTGTVTFTWPTADSWYGIFELDANGNNVGNDASGYMTTSFSFDVVEGTKYAVNFGTWHNSGEVTVTVSFTEA